MANIWMAISLHDNDFYVDLTLLGEFITKIMSFYNAHKLQADVITNPNYKENLKLALLDMLISIYKLRHLLSPNNYTEDDNNYWLNTDHIAFKHITDWFNKQFTLYFTSEEFDHAMRLINADSLSKHWSEIKYIDEFQMCDGNYEYLIIHCCDHECKSLLI